MLSKFDRNEGGSPGLVVMEGDSCCKGCGFKSQHNLLDGHFFTLICCKICNDDCLKRLNLNDKRGRLWPIKKLDRNVSRGTS